MRCDVIIVEVHAGYGEKVTVHGQSGVDCELLIGKVVTCKSYSMGVKICCR